MARSDHVEDEGKKYDAREKHFAYARRASSRGEVGEKYAAALILAGDDEQLALALVLADEVSATCLVPFALSPARCIVFRREGEGGGVLLATLALPTKYVARA